MLTKCLFNALVRRSMCGRAATDVNEESDVTASDCCSFWRGSSAVIFLEQTCSAGVHVRIYEVLRRAASDRGRSKAWTVGTFVGAAYDRGEYRIFSRQFATSGYNAYAL